MILVPLVDLKSLVRVRRLRFRDFKSAALGGPVLTWTRMQFDWRTILGPALTILVALIAFFVDRTFATVPNPAPLFVCIVALASSISGIASGLTSAWIAAIFSALFFLNHRAAPGYDAHDIARMVCSR